MSKKLFDIIRCNGEVLHRYHINALLFARGDQVKSLFFLEDGEVKLSRSLANGKELVLSRSKSPAILAEASIYSSKYHCDGQCLSACILRKVPVSRFLSKISENANLSSAWSRHLAQSLQATRYRSEILTMNKVEDRLDAWLEWQGCDFPPRGKWKEIAAEIGVSPEAFYRELAKRRINN